MNRYPRDMTGYGPTPPEAQWPDGTVSTIDVRVANSVGFPSGQLKKGDRALIVEWLNDTDDFIVDRIPAELAD